MNGARRTKVWLWGTVLALAGAALARGAEVPAADPAVEGEPARIRADVLRARPRVLFGPEDLPALRARYASEAMTPYREALLKYLPDSRPVPTEPVFLTSPTDGQRYGLWRMPTVAYHYLMTGDAESLASAKAYLEMLAAQPHWETGVEIDSGMSSANIMAGAAIVFDWLYDQLDPAFRAAFRDRLILQARRQFYGGHLGGNPRGYWLSDPFNNHRWHRNAGLSLAILAAWDGPKDDWLLTQTRKELEYIADWRAHDGSYNEGASYLLFGGVHLMLAMEASDRCFGTEFRQRPWFRNAPGYLAQMILPGPSGFFHYGDSAGGPGGYMVFANRLAGLHGRADEQAWMDRAAPRPDLHVAWMALLWRNPDLPEGNVENLPRRSVFGNVGLALLRDGWARENVAMMFKCCPIGGHEVSRFREAHDFRYVNVAHDDPDANTFVLFRNGALLAETSRYSMRKFSGNHNTILVNGRGQAPAGRDDTFGYMQPATGDSRMDERVRLTTWFDGDGFAIMEGEAGGAYLPQRAREERPASPGLERFRRAAVWREGQYVLILDDVRARADADLSWLIQAKTVDELAPGARYRLSHPEAAMDLALVSDRPLAAEIVESPADHRRTPLGWRQLRAHAKGVRSVRYAAVMTPWGGTAEVALEPAGPEDAWRVRVTRDGAVEEWIWTAVNDWKASYGLTGTLSDGRRVTVTEAHRAPVE